MGKKVKSTKNSNYEYIFPDKCTTSPSIIGFFFKLYKLKSDNITYD